MTEILGRSFSPGGPTVRDLLSVRFELVTCPTCGTTATRPWSPGGSIGTRIFQCRGGFTLRLDIPAHEFELYSAGWL